MIRKLGTYTGDFFLCLFCAPAGVLKIAHRQMKNKQGLIKGGEKLLVAAGIFFIFFFILITDSEMLTNPFTYLYGSAGALGAVLGVGMILRGKKNKRYQSAVEDHHLLSIRSIAKIVKLPEATVTADLLQMIAAGFFAELKYDVEAKTLVIKDAAPEKMQSRAVACTACGATVAVFEGKQNKCEYCGNALNY